MTKNKIELTRVSINLPTSIVDKVKEYAEKLGLNTTSAYIVLLNQALEQKDMVEVLPSVLSMFNELKTLSNNNDSGNDKDNSKGEPIIIDIKED